MTKKHLMTTLAAVMTFSLFAGLMTGCGSRNADAGTANGAGTAQMQVEELPSAGVISLKVNPEIAVSYDEKGMVTKIEGRNDDGKTVAADYTEYEGKECRQVIRDLVAKINEAGYLTEEAEGSGRTITLEIEKGSVLPSENFLSGIVADIQEYTGGLNLSAPVDVTGESNYGWTNYGDTDYGPNNDGVTDYNDTDYGPNNDGVTDYDDTDYGPNNDGVTDYDDTDYGPNNDGVTDYSTPVPAPAPSAPAYSGGNTDYDDDWDDDDDDWDDDWDDDDDDWDDDDGYTDYD